MTTGIQNRLAGQHSPYLLQHASNPVHWQPWDERALDLARSENKLMVISIGYAACHWCHVMEHESFEDAEVAAAMNRDFISVKVDREERPDVDQAYMAAAWATTGRGGWPLNVIALPDQRPVFGGTYYPKHDWLKILEYFADLFRTSPGDLAHHADELAGRIRRHDRPPHAHETPDKGRNDLADLFRAWEQELDFTFGGSRGAPKFPMPVNIDCLMHLGTRFHMPEALRHALLTLDRMALGGIYDQVGGGFSRYSVDREWHVPHFEKMLYDNAQLTGTYARAFALTGNPLYRKVVEETIAFCERELSDPSGLFYASLDADSEDMEGAFYAWTGQELKEMLTGDYDIFSALYGCKEEGNWEHGLNVLAMTAREEEFAARQGIAPEHLQAMVLSCRERLAEARLKRIRPATDDKILTCWNAMMISALAEASGVFGREEWLVRAERAATFYLSGMKARQGKLWRNAKGGTLSGTAFLDDHVFLAEAFAALYRATLESMWLEAAVEVTETAIRRFGADGGLFYRLAPADEPALFRETVEISDNVIPSANSRMAVNLLTLGHLAGRNEWIQLSGKMLSAVWPALSASPGFHAGWYSLAVTMTQGPATVSLEGDNRLIALRELAGHYLPGVICPAKSPVGAADAGTLRIYVCRDKTCYPPVSSVSEAVALLSE